MVQKESNLEVADNSGAKSLRVIHIVGSTRKRFAYLGDLIKCAVKKAIPGGKVKKGDVVLAVVVRTRKETRREDGSYVRFGDNAAVIVGKDLEPIATRMFGPMARELRAKKFDKIISLAPEVV
jgi:large subunit ribosomal protein L14